MAQIRFASVEGEDLSVPDRICGDDGPEITIIVCESGEFIDPSSETLKFMPMPEPPVIEKLDIQHSPGAVGDVQFDDGVWHPTDEELQLAKDEAAEMSSIPGVTKKRLNEAMRRAWGWP